MQSMTIITKRGAQNKTKAKTDQSTHARTHSVYVRVKNSIPKNRLDFFLSDLMMIRFQMF